MLTSASRIKINVLNQLYPCIFSHLALIINFYKLDVIGSRIGVCPKVMIKKQLSDGIIKNSAVSITTWSLTPRCQHDFFPEKYRKEEKINFKKITQLMFDFAVSMMHRSLTQWCQ